MGATRAGPELLVPLTTVNQHLVAHLQPANCATLAAEVLLLESQCHIDQADEYRDRQKGADDRGEGLPGLQAEHGDGYGDGQFKVVGSGSEGETCRCGIIRPELMGQKKGEKEHDDEVDGQWNGYADHIHGK